MRTKTFVDALAVDEMVAQLLAIEGFISVEVVAFVPVEELAEIEGFDLDLAKELSRRANAHIEELNRQHDARRIELGVADEVAAIEGLTPAMLVVLGEQGVKSLDDLGDLASDELIEALPDARLGEEQANAIIMAARAHWFDDEPEAPEEGAEADAAVAEPDAGESPAGAGTEEAAQ